MKIKPLIFLHIPKTGGISLKNILKRMYQHKGKIVNVGNDRKLVNFESMSPLEKEKVILLKGHMAFGAHVHFPHPEEVQYITMLRDPIRRIISSYHFILKRTEHPMHQKLMDNKYSLKEYVASGVFLNSENAQVRFLSSNLYAEHGTCTRAMLEQAKTNLKERFAVVGLNERYDEALVLMQQEFGWKTPFYLQSNVTGHGVEPGDLDEDTLATIKKYNALDNELYAYAETLFDEKVAAFSGDCSRAVQQYKRRNYWAQKLIRIKRKLF